MSANNSNSDSRTKKPTTGELREKLKNPDMSLFDRFMKHVVNVPKDKISKRTVAPPKRGR
jgi:hypothetical protein